MAMFNRAVLILLITLTAVLALPTQASTVPPDTVRLHFHRDDPDYNGWGLHLWGDALNLPRQSTWSEPYPPSGSDSFGVYFDIPLQPGARSFGFVLHRGEQKNAPFDQYWYQERHGNQIWLLEGNATLFTARPQVREQVVRSMEQGVLDRVPVWVWSLLGALAAVLVIGHRMQRRAEQAEARLQEQAALLAQARGELANQIEVFHTNEQRLRQLSGRDELTGLPTRASLQQALANMQSRARRHEGKVALIFIDLDNFKTINDTEGHAAGDAVLKAVASRFTQIMRESDVVARMGGDEFVIVAEEVVDERDVAAVARKLIKAACTPVEHEGRLHQVGASVGIAIYPTDSADGATLLKQADTAMYAAKGSGKGQFRFFSEAANLFCAKETDLDERMAGALARQEMALELLPIMAPGAAHPHAFEAFLRWRQADGSHLPAREFIEIAEINGRIVELGHWLIHHACALAGQWYREAGDAAPRIAINLSLSQLHDKDLLAVIHRALLKHAVAAERLVLEITSAALHAEGQAQINLRSLQAIGVGLALDKADPAALALADIADAQWCWLKLDTRPLLGHDAERHARLWQTALAAAQRREMAVVATLVESVSLKEAALVQGCSLLEGYAIAKGQLLEPDQTDSLV
ncbi:diguanylate cyclase domain-containing protein [Chitinimonas sp. BJYL2]|uniref:diguanylate cyclase domain-containing protein n=1 Tax=Chitinimonas sp. BJYL2 TaxID=2976696 RepID=UPI0022B44C31|nr:diguanylate cyclase [Chitinimonas sp. BJYL2]